MRTGGARQLLRRVLHQQSVLAKFAKQVIREPDLQKILTDAARACANGTGVRYCKVLRYRPSDNDLIVQAGVGWRRNIIGKAIAPANRSSPDGHAFVTGKPVITSDLRKLHDYKLPDIYSQHKIVSSANVVIPSTGKKPYGVLEVDSTKRGEFDCYDIDFLTALGGLLAEAIALAGRVADLREANAEKETLAQELQHRVRNHLQFVQQFLKSRAAEVQDRDVRRSIEDIAGRVMTLGHLYDQLLGVGMGSQLRLDKYLKSLCDGIESFNAAANAGIDIVCHLEPVSLDVDRTTILGLIANELISNSYEHAFPDAEGRIHVDLRRPPRSRDATLVVADNGSGFAENAESSRRGVGLVRRLAEQIDGKAELSTGNGTRWEISFPV
ncbi:MAG TPA: GAF domain-containing protein [Alphaproteobacteria bacterium]